MASHLHDHGCRVVIHVDSATSDREYDKLVQDLSDRDIVFAKRHRCEWGTYALHEAALEASRLLIESFQDVEHVCLVSGSCLPIRPVAELIEHLAQNPDTDFVESRVLGQEQWVQDGLAEERFSLYFPFGWRSNRWLFDKFVDLQRRMGVKRAAPKHLTLALGSQWWTLSRQTLRAILDDPLKGETDRFFRHCWIVDEAYVQTLVRRHSKKLVTRSLCLTEFDPQGKPFTFYDDHAHLLQSTDHFFARKIWHGATGLYNKYLSGVEPITAARRPKREALPDVVAAGRDRRCRGRTGLLSQSRFPAQGFTRQPQTARSYLVLDGYDFLFKDMPEWLRAQGADTAHGRLFHPERVELEQDSGIAPGAVVSNAKIRDWNEQQFLTNLIWSDQERQQSFLFHVSDSTPMASFLLRDPNAQIFFIKGAWVFNLTPSAGEDPRQFRRRALRLKLLEQKHIAELEQQTTQARVHVWELADVLANPAAPLRAVADAIEGRPAAELSGLPTMRSEHGMDQLVHRLHAETAREERSSVARFPLRRLRSAMDARPGPSEGA
ncbi:beta-1,6-N-acetylglucosaminyltransferase [Pontivivens ytuae]|uniref:Peptide O-xylosyltransferase n=1 Tax=Pontivivens ytuae TaxID=2789856 RepID=A0A7S9QF39_9RHOB|nr:beta-1,6-N-acetylglucosaminyltransferase [Pontivivens ytuae]QPH55851.1 glycosyl transferase [Pontivivens ytuae]